MNVSRLSRFREQLDGYKPYWATNRAQLRSFFDIGMVNLMFFPLPAGIRRRISSNLKL
jgi:hypothetical protein